MIFCGFWVWFWVDFVLGWFWVGFGIGFPTGFELILSCFVLILSYFLFDFVDFVFGLSNVEMGCGGRLVIVGWCCVCIWLILSWPMLVCNRGAKIWGRREKPEFVWEFVSEEEERLKREPNWKIIKISNTRVIVTVHICTVIVAIVYKYTILHPLMWVFFWPKCVKWRDFCILEDYAPTDVDALSWGIIKHTVSKGTRLLSSWFGCFGFAFGFYFLGLCVFDSVFV